MPSPRITTGYSVPPEAYDHLHKLADTEFRTLSLQFSWMLAQYAGAALQVRKRRTGEHVTLSLRQSIEDIDRLEALAAASGTTLSAIVTQVILDYQP